ncbi:MAG: hypothetical protein KatS3mg081_2608 [Gemmatimonadales bacterium]|nr:MAG: hypothetical protein KatS3mg081_2608 [Gemmatimonadales bacterium]
MLRVRRFAGLMGAGALAVLGIFTAAVPAAAQNPRDRIRDWEFWRAPPRYPTPETRRDRYFSFARVAYRSVRWEPGGQGWRTDYPNADVNFMRRLAELTTAVVSGDDEEGFHHFVVELDDPRLFEFPFIFMSDVGTAGFSPEEARRLREYLLRGGFLWVDDFWGDRAWEQWVREIGKVLPLSEYPIFDLPPDHPIFHSLYDVERVPQIPSIQFWRRSGGATSERGAESAVPHLRGIADHSGRLMVLMSHNTDIADGWEREGEEYEFFYRFSPDAYALAINIVLYAMTH